MIRRPPKGHRWADLQNPKSDNSAEDAREARADAIFAQVFSTAAGAQALEFMHVLTTWKRNAPVDSDGALRELEAQRRFVAILEARIARHNERVKRQAEKTNGGTGGPKQRLSRRKSH